MSDSPVVASKRLNNVRYEIRGDLAGRAYELERRGLEIVHLNIGNPGRFGFRAPETLRLAMIENLSQSEAYSHQKGVFPAREAVVMQQQNRGVMDAKADQVFLGNGVSELIDLTLRALIDPGDEILVPSPDYPLWSAAVTLNGGNVVHYPCPPDNRFQPDLEMLASLITKRTKALVIINPNNPTGAVYSRATLQAMADLAERHGLVVMADEIYDQMLYDDAEFVPMATLARNSVCATFSGLSKVYRACGYRVGWVSFSGDTDSATGYLKGLELLAALRLCSNVPGQWAVQTALGGYQSIQELVRPGGRLYESRQAILDAVEQSEYLDVVCPMGSMYAFVGVRPEAIPNFDDQVFARKLLDEQQVLLAPGTSFNTPYKTHFRLTLLPRAEQLHDVFGRIDTTLGELHAELTAA